MTEVLRYEQGTLSLGESVVALGAFDGVHVGHQALIRDAVALSHEIGSGCCVATFDQDPERVINPHAAVPQLTALDEKISLISALGPDHILVVPFDEDLAALEPEAFIDDVLLDALVPRAVVVGEDFRFGAFARGDVSTLRRCGAQKGFSVVAHDLVQSSGGTVTSTRIRQLLSQGDVAQAAQLLGRPHKIRGVVVPGCGRGSRLGMPTANISFDESLALPAPGVYAGYTLVGEHAYPSALIVGRPPTFPDATSVLEAHLLDFTQRIYSASVAVEFVERLRDLQAFADEESLRSAMAEDISRVRALLR